MGYPPGRALLPGGIAFRVSQRSGRLWRVVPAPSSFRVRATIRISAPRPKHTTMLLPNVAPGSPRRCAGADAGKGAERHTSGEQGNRQATQRVMIVLSLRTAGRQRRPRSHRVASYNDAQILGNGLSSATKRHQMQPHRSFSRSYPRRCRLRHSQPPCSVPCLSPAQDGKTRLQFAMENGHGTLADALLEKGALVESGAKVLNIASGARRHHEWYDAHE